MPKMRDVRTCAFCSSEPEKKLPNGVRVCTPCYQRRNLTAQSNFLWRRRGQVELPEGAEVQRPDRFWAHLRKTHAADG
jgi:hypothetical protein